jgi:hypothetical protein
VLRGLPPGGAMPGGGAELDLVELRKRYAEGKTILVHSVQLRVPAVAALARSLEAALHHPVNVNMYLTPPGAQGFGPHFDDHDVFIVQLDGHKNWRLYESVRQLPLKSEDPIVPPERLTGPVEEVRLEPGDLLYLPRGFVHEAFTSEHASLHLTVGIEVLRWADLLTHAVACASMHEAALREAVPPGWVDGASAAPLGARFRELLRLLADCAELDDAVAELGEQFIGGLAPLPDGRFAEQTDPQDIDLDTPLQKRPGTVCQVVNRPSYASIRFPGNQIGGPGTIGPALRFLGDVEGEFTARDLPDGLTDNARLVLLRRLVREGLLTTVAAAGDTAPTGVSDASAPSL